MPEPLETSDLLGIVTGYKFAAALYAVVALAIPSALAAEPLSADAVATRVGVDAPTLARVLDLLVSRGALIKEDGTYSNSPLTASLAGGEGRAMFLGWSASPPFVEAWGGIAEGLKRGATPFEAVHGQGLHEYFHDHPQAAQRYDAAMGSTVESFEGVAQAVDFADKSVVVVVGGASGIEIVPLLRRWPHLRGVVTDLPGALHAAPKVLADYDLADRVDLVEGDARIEAPAGDAYVLSTVLRCLGDADAIAMLAAIRRAALPGASVHAIEMPIPEGPPLHPNATTDLTAWVAYGGADRTEARWREMFEEAGWPRMTSAPLEESYRILSATAE